MARAVLAALAAMGFVVGAVGFAGCGSSGGGTTEERDAEPTAEERPLVVLGVQRSSEQQLLGELYRQALTAKGYRVRLRPRLSSLQAAHAAFLHGSVEMYPTDLGLFDAQIAHRGLDAPNLPDALAAARIFAFHHHYRVLPATPFADGDVLVVRRAFAHRHRLASIGDLARAGRLRLGVASSARSGREGALAALRRYGIDDVTTALVRADGWDRTLDRGRIDLASVHETDWRITKAYVTLTDPKHAFGFHNVILVLTGQLEDLEGPEFTTALNDLTTRLSSPAMRAMNAALAHERRSPQAVARAFLSDRHLD